MTGTKSKNNIKLYYNVGYTEFANQVIDEELELVYLEKSKKGDAIVNSGLSAST